MEFWPKVPGVGRDGDAKTSTSEGPWIRLEYQNLRSLERDHEDYFANGGMRVRSPLPGPLWKGQLNHQVDLQVSAPAIQLSFPARLTGMDSEAGLMLTFEPAASSARRELADFLWVKSINMSEPLLSPEVIYGVEDPDALVEDLVQPDEPQSPAASPPPPDTDRPPIRRAAPGERYWACIVRYPTVLSYEPSAKSLLDSACLTVPLPDGAPLDPEGMPILLTLILPSREQIEMWAGATLVPGGLQLWMIRSQASFDKAIKYLTTPTARSRKETELAQALEASEPDVQLQEHTAEDDDKMPLRRRIQRMGFEEKMNLALSGGREARLALAQDGNRAIHPFLLKNAKLSMDEVVFMARTPSLNPDVLERIAENPQYAQNVSVVKALVFNPRTPIRTSIRLLDRLPKSDLRMLAGRTGMQRRLVLAAKNKLRGGR